MRDSSGPWHNLSIGSERFGGNEATTAAQRARSADAFTHAVGKTPQTGQRVVPRVDQRPRPDQRTKPFDERELTAGKQSATTVQVFTEVRAARVGGVLVHGGNR